MAAHFDEFVHRDRGNGYRVGRPPFVHLPLQPCRILVAADKGEPVVAGVRNPEDVGEEP